MGIKVAIRPGSPPETVSSESIWFESLGEVATWPDDLRVAWEERSAILEYCEGMPRAEAERHAFKILNAAPRPMKH